MKFFKNIQIHPFHLVDPSPWPLIASLGCFFLTYGTVMFFHNFSGGFFMMLLGFMLISYIMFTWWRDIIREATFEGQHTFKVQQGLSYGMLLFIISEVMLFFSFFWAFFHSAITPVPEIGSVWPPQYIEVLNPWEIPLFNTIILLSSGVSITWAHFSIINGSRKETLISLCVTLGLAFMFISLQALEYISSKFNISDSIYGSIFYIATGFHGLHVIIGTIFLFICTFRIYNYHFTKQHHFGFEAAAWYWHFVDVVWLFLFIVVYWWGGH